MNLNNQNLLLTSAWINGKEVNTDKTFEVINPATRELISTVQDVGKEQALEAVEVANETFKSWRKVPPRKRASIITKWSELLKANAEDLGRILSLENGKPQGEAKGEILHSASMLRWYAQEVLRLHGETLPAHADNQRNYTIKQPLGVVACITPWNFPSASVLVKTGAAIVSGCTTIIKPSDETPLIALAFARLAKEAGVPDGAYNVLPCKNPKEVGDVLCSHKDVRMLSFTGSTKIGKLLYSQCGETMKRVAFELGGNAPFIVFNDADVDKAVSGALGARFYNNGQICVGANRFFIHKDIYNEFATKLSEKVSKFKTGNGQDEGTNLGPMINQVSMDRMQSIVADAKAKGAKVLTGGEALKEESLFYKATVLTQMTSDMLAYESEIFGPIACLYSFETEEEVLEKANDTDAGLSAYVYTNDLSKLMRFSEELEAGVVGANSANIFSDDLPFGGFKQSGIGKEQGMNCLEEFVETKSICLGLN